MLLLQVVKELVRIDPRYRLTIGGKVQDLRFKLYFDQMIPAMGLTPHIRFDGWRRPGQQLVERQGLYPVHEPAGKSGAGPDGSHGVRDQTGDP